MKQLFASHADLDKKIEQDRIAKYINDYVYLADGEVITDIAFTDFEKNEMTGSWMITTKINGKYDISFSETTMGGKLRALGYFPNEIDVRTEKEVGRKDFEALTITYVEVN
ncbi:hypothetical protein [Streptococcus iniae]|uniref:Uncharacterized protein n=1 Tax=Streptococcus iniae TaxID=1346 RepID=A0A3L8GNN6_STRIN|nr:hypothetical protein [Streptococcus iniae]AGM98160.1 hypothetical protein K710_0358 [Streptococcus iniae SF1]AHY15224.1 hypothetical protein DQ08_01715 [Streptococcus iniae]AHY17093.1 hypothetical protein DW64_01700 [Streptococcus iniae]AJG25406.1 hypothetical protein SI82_01990 [Streptococcus iniae]APD31277.1 hypothetical protein BMF34_01885 [Streptococcus iniae]